MAEGFGLVAVRMNRLARSMGGDGLKALSETAALTVKKEAERQLVIAVGGDRALEGYGRGRRRGRVKGSVGFDYVGKGASDIKYRPPGMWVMLERGSYKSGNTWKAPRRRGSARRARGTVGSYTHEPVRARGTVATIKRNAEPKIPPAVEQELRRLIDRLLST